MERRDFLARLALLPALGIGITEALKGVILNDGKAQKLLDSLPREGETVERLRQTKPAEPLPNPAMPRYHWNQQDNATWKTATATAMSGSFLNASGIYGTNATHFTTHTWVEDTLTPWYSTPTPGNQHDGSKD
jgi:hypothetical protein